MKTMFLFFLKVGGISFGKMVATNSMYDEYVELRHTLSKEDFFTLNGFLQIFPGPTQSQMSIALGSLEHGVLGGIAAGCAYLLPSFTLITLGAYLYFEQSTLLPMGTIFYGINIISLALLCFSSANMARKSVSNLFDGSIVVGAFFLAYMRVSIFWIFVTAVSAAFIRHGGLGILIRKIRSRLSAFDPAALSILIFIFGFFFKVGLFIYGGGLVMIPLIRSTIVDQLGWLSPADFLAGFALGQSTPGPVILTVAFVGYRAALLAGLPGFMGAVTASVAVMLPSFILILSLGRFFPKLKQMNLLPKVLQALMPAMVGSVLAESIPFFFQILTAPVAWGIMLLALLLLYLKVSPLILIASGAFIGFIPGI